MTLGSEASFDTYYRSAGNVLTRLANGTTGQVLKATTGAAPSWGSVSASVTITETEVDFGSTPVTDATFTITDAGVSGTTKIIVTESGSVATGRAAGDSLWDSINYSALSGTGNFTLYAKASGSVVGKRKLYYTIS